MVQNIDFLLSIFLTYYLFMVLGCDLILDHKPKKDFVILGTGSYFVLTLGCTNTSDHFEKPK